MWNVNVSITNNTDYTVSLYNSFIAEQTISPYNSVNWNTSDSPNTTSLKFWKVDSNIVDFQGGFVFGIESGVWADRGYMEVPSVIMDVDVNGTVVTQELNGGQTIVEDFTMGGNIAITFRNKVYTQEFRLG